MKELLLKIGSVILLGGGVIFGAVMTFGAWQEDFKQLKEKVSAHETQLEFVTRTMSRMDKNISYMRGRMDKNYDPHEEE